MMSHTELLMVLHDCPMSEYFGHSKVKLNAEIVTKKKARQLVIAMIKRCSIQIMDVIPEFPSNEERGSSYGMSIRSLNSVSRDHRQVA